MKISACCYAIAYWQGQNDPTYKCQDCSKICVVCDVDVLVKMHAQKLEKLALSASGGYIANRNQWENDLLRVAVAEILHAVDHLKLAMRE